MDGSNTDPEKWEKEQRLRYERNKMIHEYLVDSRPVFYISSGNSMWPLVQSNDGCTFHPIQAVRDMVGEHAVHKEASEIGVGDIVFCQVQPSQHYYAHFVLSIEQDYYANEEKYWIGNIQEKRNGWCYLSCLDGCNSRGPRNGCSSRGPPRDSASRRSTSKKLLQQPRTSVISATAETGHRNHS